MHRAEVKRDRAQARVDALAIIADEVGAQLADLGRTADEVADTTKRAEDEAGSKADGEPVPNEEPQPKAHPKAAGEPTPEAAPTT